MSKFTDRLRKIFNPKLQAQIEFNRSVGLNDNAKVKALSKLPHNMYFIRSVENPELFVHFKGESTTQVEYILKEGPIMACVWDWQRGQAFIKSGAENLELVRADVVLKPQQQ